MRTFSVVTTIHAPSAALRSLAAQPGWPCIVVGDRKTPRGLQWPHGVCFLPFSPEATAASRGPTSLGLQPADLIDTELAAALPPDHYARKNLGYIAALRSGADVIYETDDDNQPLGTLSPPPTLCAAHCLSGTRSAGGLRVEDSQATDHARAASPEFVNVYKAFTTANVWPRGLPLERVLDPGPIVERGEPRRVGVWQGLVDGEPDVDAIYRLVSNEPVRFARAVSVTQLPDAGRDDAAARGTVTGVVLPKGRYCPFNSQNTYWFAEAFPALYLPAWVSSRVSDILRGYVAQRLLWECGLHLAFSAPTAVQQRNPHDLIRDFRDELDLYLNAAALCRALDHADLGMRSIADLPTALIEAYSRLAGAKLVPAGELRIVRAWVAALDRARAAVPRRAAA